MESAWYVTGVSYNELGYWHLCYNNHSSGITLLHGTLPTRPSWLSEHMHSAPGSWRTFPGPLQHRFWLLTPQPNPLSWATSIFLNPALLTGSPFEMLKLSLGWPPQSRQSEPTASGPWEASSVSAGKALTSRTGSASRRWLGVCCKSGSPGRSWSRQWGHLSRSCHGRRSGRRVGTPLGTWPGSQMTCGPSRGFGSQHLARGDISQLHICEPAVCMNALNTQEISIRFSFSLRHNNLQFCCHFSVANNLLMP